MPNVKQFSSSATNVALSNNAGHIRHLNSKNNFDRPEWIVTISWLCTYWYLFNYARNSDNHLKFKVDQKAKEINSNWIAVSKSQYMLKQLVVRLLSFIIDYFILVTFPLISAHCSIDMKRNFSEPLHKCHSRASIKASWKFTNLLCIL